MFGEDIDWEIDGHTITAKVGPNTSQTDISTFFKVTATPKGILLYPQKNLYYWIPSSAFASPSAYESAIESLSAAPRFFRLK